MQLAAASSSCIQFLMHHLKIAVKEPFSWDFNICEGK